MSSLNAPRPVAPFGAETIYALVRGLEGALRAVAGLHKPVRRAASLKGMNVRMLDDLGLAGVDLRRRVARGGC